MDDYAISTADDSISLFNLGQYGEPQKGGGLKLSIFETLHLFEREKIKVFHNDESLSSDALLQLFDQYDGKFLIKYFIYKDLRNRGYVVKQDKSLNGYFNLFDRGNKVRQDKPLFYVIPLTEGRVINIVNLKSIITTCQDRDIDLLIGLIDASGDVSYLKIDLIQLKKNSNQQLYLSNFSW